MPERWIIVGDSLVTHAQPYGHAKESLSYHLMHRYDVNVCLLASGGQTMTGQACRKLPAAIEYIDGPLRTVDKLVVALGTNDWAMNIFNAGIPRKAYSDAYQAFLRSVPDHLNVFCVTPLTRTDEHQKNLQGWPLKAYREDTRRVSENYGATTLDGSAVFNKAKEPNFMEDGIHLTAKGTQMYADWLWKNTTTENLS